MRAAFSRLSQAAETPQTHSFLRGLAMFAIGSLVDRQTYKEGVRSFQEGFGLRSLSLL